ncbi:hypothetical protein JB92DRAFT_3119238 [Gautieria morchelliformis]|nr:hypothetical protein JB92DRAFT_3119238 [Gautieria morchelliformis]
MLLRLVAPPPLPTILFTLSFPALPQSLPVPAAWENHLQLLVHYQLSSPPSLHALDKSVAWTALLDTVTFDLVTLTVTCVFVDGIQEEWPLTNRCVDLLESVIRDVNRSATEAEIEYELERRKTDVDLAQSSSSNSHVSLAGAEQASEQPTPIVAQKVQKPKKRRSILASFMASLVSSSSSLGGLVAPYRASTPPPATQLPPPPPPPSPAMDDLEPLTTNGIPASRFLRRRARSTLVDAYRRFVVGELGARFRTGDPTLYDTNGGGFKALGIDMGTSQTPLFALWVTRSTMRRVAEEMARVIEYALCGNGARERDQDGSQRKGRFADKFGEGERSKDDDRDGDDSGCSASSTTDDSSVHTPLDSHDTPPPYNLSSPQPKHQAAPSRSPTVMTPQAYHAYISLKEMHHRLHGIACQLTADTVASQQAATVEAGGAEVKSKRRAWSSRQYLAGARSPSADEDKGHCAALRGASMALVGLAVPVRSSPLCSGWSAEELEADELDARKRGRCVRWEQEAEHEETFRRARSLCREQSQRRRCYFGATGRSCEAEDVHPLGRMRPRTLNVTPEEGPFGLVYSTGPRLSVIEHADVGHLQEHDEYDENENDTADEDEDEDDTLYKKRSEEEFILHPEESRSWPQSHRNRKTPRPAINNPVLSKDLRLRRSMPGASITQKLHPTVEIAVEERCAEPSRFPPDFDPSCAVDI